MSAMEKLMVILQLVLVRVQRANGYCKTYFSSPKSRSSLTTSWPGVSISLKALLLRKSLMLAGSCSLAFMSSSIWSSLSSLAESSSSVSASAALRKTVVEKAARAGRRALREEVLTKVLGRATADWRRARRATARGADRAKVRTESIVNVERNGRMLVFLVLVIWYLYKLMVDAKPPELL